MVLVNGYVYRNVQGLRLQLVIMVMVTVMVSVVAKVRFMTMVMVRGNGYCQGLWLCLWLGVMVMDRGYVYG